MTEAIVPNWLRETRLRQSMPENGRPWTQEYLVGEMRAVIGWAPSRPNYVHYEKGDTKPKPETLAKIVDFWARMGEPGPDYDRRPEPEPSSDVDRLVVAMASQQEVIAEQAKAISALAAQVDALVKAQPSAEDLLALVRTMLESAGAAVPAVRAPRP